MQGALLIEAGISSSYHIAKFFGLTQRICEPPKITEPAAKPILPKPRRKRRRGIDIGAVISRALTAVGLKKWRNAATNSHAASFSVLVEHALDRLRSFFRQLRAASTTFRPTPIYAEPLAPLQNPT